MTKTDVQALLNPGERIDDLLTMDMKIIQSKDTFSFSLDAVLLARWCKVPKRGRVVDLCTGNGIIPLLLSTRSSASIVGVEIQPKIADMAARNVKLNQLQHRLDVVCDDLRSYVLHAGHGTFDMVTVNPPYFGVKTGEHRVNRSIAAARHETAGTLVDIVLACAKLVKSGGKVALVHRPSRLADIITTLRAVKLEPKRMQLVHPRMQQEANMVLIEAMKDAKAELRVLPPLIVHQSDGAYTPEVHNILYGHSLDLISE